MDSFQEICGIVIDGWGFVSKPFFWNEGFRGDGGGGGAGRRRINGCFSGAFRQQNPHLPGSCSPMKAEFPLQYGNRSSGPTSE